VKRPTEIAIPIDRGTVTAIVYAADGAAEAALVLAHGAGAGQRSTFMTTFAGAIAERGLDAVTFDFPYTEQGRRMPDRRPALEACYRAAIAAVVREVPGAARGLFIGGKSMGGRIATHVAAADGDQRIDGIVLLGYPLHPPGRPGERRDSHLPAVGRPMLFVQGSRDTFGTPAELEPVVGALTPAATLHVVDGGDHSFKVAGADARRQTAILGGIQQAIVEWIRGVIGGGPRPPAQGDPAPRV
jgi:predicted alpha/beta-hydrolase family hydrolase